MPTQDRNATATSSPTDVEVDSAVPDSGLRPRVTEIVGEGTIVSHGETIAFSIAIHSTDRGAAGRCLAQGDHGTFIKLRTLTELRHSANTVTFNGHAVINGKYLSYHAEVVKRDGPEGFAHDSFIIRAANRSYLGNVSTGHIAVEDHDL